MKISEEKLNRLSERERMYLDIMMSGNSLYLRGKPGMAKSAIGLSITKKIGIKYLDKRLSQIDETDIGLYPVLNDSFTRLDKLGKLKKMGYIKDEEYNKLKESLLESFMSDQENFLHFAVPKWAFNANIDPTIIHLEELNRANIHVRNAALQLLNERQIGDLKLNENVLLMSSGNLGESDGTEVEEMDLALSNRLVIFDHELPYEEWIKEYAQYHVWGIIINYIRANPGEYYKLPNEKELRYATPRSWTNLSKFLKFKFGDDPKLDLVVPMLLKVGSGFIGNSITNFIRYCQDISNININDILIRWNEVKDEVVGFNRSRISELISNLKFMDLTVLEDQKIENLINFLNSLGGNNDDELTSYLIHILDNTNSGNEEIHTRIIKSFSSKVKGLMEHTSRNLKKK